MIKIESQKDDPEYIVHTIISNRLMSLKSYHI